MKLNMTIDEALEFADEWSRGMTLHEGSQGWRVVCMLLAEEVRRMREGLTLITCESINAEYMAQNILDGLPAYHDTMINALGQEPCAAVCARSPEPEGYTSGTTEKE